MATEKMWMKDVNRVNAGNGAILSANQYLAWYIKQMLAVGIGTITPTWTVYYSCDGTTAGVAGDGVDRWGSSASCVFATGALAHSWMVLKSSNFTSGALAAVPLYLLITCTNVGQAAGANVGAFRVQISKTAPTGGSTTVDPTLGATDWVGSSTTITNGLYAVQDTTNHHVHGLVTSDGSQWTVVSSKDGTGIAECIIEFGMFSDAKATDAYPYFMFQAFNATNSGAQKGANYSTYWNQNSGAAQGLYARTAANALGQHPVLIPSVTSGTLITDVSTTPATDSADGTSWMYPVEAGFAGNYHFKGRIADKFLGPAYTGVQGQQDSTLCYALVGCMWLPFATAPGF